MTDISDNAPIATLGLSQSRLRFPKLAVASSFKAIFYLVGDAFMLAYAGACRSVRRQAQIVPDDDLDGRDPNW